MDVKGLKTLAKLEHQLVMKRRFRKETVLSSLGAHFYQDVAAEGSLSLAPSLEVKSQI